MSSLLTLTHLPLVTLLNPANKGIDDIITTPKESERVG